jgi:hypothetical protein
VDEVKVKMKRIMVKNANIGECRRLLAAESVSGAGFGSGSSSQQWIS